MLISIAEKKNLCNVFYPLYPYPGIQGFILISPALWNFIINDSGVVLWVRETVMYNLLSSSSVSNIHWRQKKHVLSAFLSRTSRSETINQTELLTWHKQEEKWNEVSHNIRRRVELAATWTEQEWTLNMQALSVMHDPWITRTLLAYTSLKLPCVWFNSFSWKYRMTSLQSQLTGPISITFRASAAVWKATNSTTPLRAKIVGLHGEQEKAYGRGIG